MKTHKKLQSFERDQIALLLATKTSLREIARQLGRAYSSIRDEVARNSRHGVYQAIVAQNLTETRNTASRKTNPLKNPSVYSYVLEKLRDGWSPEEIAGRLKRDHGDQTVICHETIYKYIYSETGKQKHLHEYLVRKHRKRRPWYGRCLYRRGITNRVSIRLRPEVINTRNTFGHWEGDVVEGKAHLGGIQTTLERKTRLYQAKLLRNIDSEEGVKAQQNILRRFPKRARRTLTLDNGRENYNHEKLKQNLGVKVFFCDPNCAWQKGSNEHFNGILRRYIPKSTDLTTVSQFELDEIVEEINNRPLKCLGYETPTEAFTRELKSTNYKK